MGWVLASRAALGTNKPTKKKLSTINRERQTTHGECESINPRDFAAEGEEGLGVECMFVILVIVPHSLDHLLSFYV